ncbi:MAG: L-seryl-tRNA(Ser) seleniumtransferase [Thermosediminibacterales bacterium]|nr:L-seryl-tRNA(Ser) seleniumtransferase [Thermosediminibacterales bacterium]
MQEKNWVLRKLPAVDIVLNSKKIKELEGLYPKEIIADTIREVIERERQKILKWEGKMEEELDDKRILDNIVMNVIIWVEKKFKPSLKRVVNATGTVLHTNLGRSILPASIREHLYSIIAGYSSLEYDIDKGERGSRYSHVEPILCSLTGAEGAMVVNNNAGAVLLVLSAIASGKEVIISRGQLVEIGGSFRIPEVLAQSGAKLIEVGTTNKTYLRDYEEKINENTGALLKVHTSNYAICGFTSAVKSEELVFLGQKYDIPVIEDLGSGTLIDLSKYGLSPEPTVQRSIKAGIDVVTFSGDKLLGGPQGGIIVGKRKYIDRIKKHPLTRALRVDKMTLGALEYVLKLYVDESKALKEIPTLKMLTLSPEKISERANELYKAIKERLGKRVKTDIIETYSIVGGGAFPVDKLPSKGVSVSIPGLSVCDLEKRLRLNEIPIITRIEKDLLILDVRSIQHGEVEIIADALMSIVDSITGDDN